MRGLFKTEVKVAQLSGYISDITEYHHGEASLQDAIIGMAQNFVGANNINLLVPSGNFGTRRAGGNDYSSPRYIFTQISDITPYIFRKEDSDILTYVEEDSRTVEPVTYAPIIPLILINGTNGIGTGFSTRLWCYNFVDIIKNLKLLLSGKNPLELTPWYKGFKGKITKLDETTYESHGIYEIIDENTIIIDELPIEIWTDSYKDFVDSLIADDPKNPEPNKLFKNITHDSGNNFIKIKLEFLDNSLQALSKKGEIEKKLKLSKRHPITNMHLYNSHEKIQKYNSALDILKEYYEYRLRLYDLRKNYHIKFLEKKLNIINWKIKFIDDIITGKIIIFNIGKSKTKSEIINKLSELKYPLVDESYDYLISLPIVSLTDEEKNRLIGIQTTELAEYDAYKNTSIQTIWLSELAELEKIYYKWLAESISELENKDHEIIEDKKKGKKK